jgi:choice-of-anchor B domain-containing protein
MSLVNLALSTLCVAGSGLFLSACGGGGGGSGNNAAAPPAPAPPPEVATGPFDCVDRIAGEFPCEGISLLKKIPYSLIGGDLLINGTAGSDVWGWRDSQTGREYALVALTDGTAFVDITEPENPQHLGVLPSTRSDSGERDVKVYMDHAFVVAGPARHGLQVFDLKRLRGVTDPQVFSAEITYLDFGEAKGLASNESSGFAYVVLTDTCGRGLHVVDIQTPINPMFAGCYSFAESLDAQCIDYDGPDTDHLGKEICFGSNIRQFDIIDVTTKSSPALVSTLTHPTIALYHQGWLTEDRRFFFLDDESDERDRGVPTTTHIIDVSDLDNPVYAFAYGAQSNATDHNQFVLGNRVFQANFTSGLRVLEFGDLDNREIMEIAYFDTIPNRDDPDNFVGTTGVYPFLPSGTIVVSDTSGLFLLVME